MFPAVVVDLGPEVSRTETSWVLQACNAAIPRGSCVLDVDLDGALPRAIALVRREAGGQRAVRIEVGLRNDTHDHWSVRELEFAEHDPPRERWRSVGLVLASLVGLVEAAQQAREAGEPPPAEMASPPGTASADAPSPDAGSAEAPSPDAASALPNAPRSAPSTSTPNPSPAAAADATAPARRSSAGAAVSKERSAARLPADRPAERPAAAAVGVDHIVAASSIAEPLPRPSLFVGAGVLAAPGQPGSSWRWGAGIRGGWVSATGWLIQGSGDYSSLSLASNGVELSWWRLSAGVGHRWWAAPAWSFALALGAGVQGLHASSPEAGSLPGSAWSPLVVGSADLWWQMFAAGGAWVGVDLSSIGRSARVRGREGEALASVPLAESHALFGFWWAP